MAVKDDSRDLGDEIERIMEGLAKSGELAGVFAAHGVEYRPRSSPDARILPRSNCGGDGPA